MKTVVHLVSKLDAQVFDDLALDADVCLDGIVILVVRVQLKEYSARGAGCGGGAQAIHLRFRQNAERIRTCRDVAGRVSSDAGSVDRRNPIQRTLRNLVNVLAAAIEDAGVTGYLEINRRVEEAAAASQHGLTVTGYLPCKSHTWRDVGITWHRVRLAIPIQSTPKIERQTRIHFPGVLGKCS